MTRGNTYYVRVYTDPNAAGGTFNICITDPAPANDLCGGAVPLTTGGSCTPTTGSLAGSTYTALTTAGCGTTNRNDVWYSFVAQTTNPTITVTSSNIANLRIQLFSNACGATLTPVGSCGNAIINATGLTIGATYRVRVYADPNSDDYGTFTICVTEPANDECAGALPVSHVTACGAITGNFFKATFSSSVPVAPCTGPVVYDLWYYFIAAAPNATVTMSGVGSAINTPRVQVFSGACGALTSIACGTPLTASLTGLVPGDYYYVRVYASAGTAPASTTNAGFSLCVLYTVPPAGAAPANDNCAGAITIIDANTCGRTMGTVVNATASVGQPFGACTSGAAYDVWYKFVATATNPTITLGDFGSGFGGTRRMQLMQGTCPGGLTSVAGTACGTTSINATGLTIGNTYFIRVYTTTGPAPTFNGDFSICVSNPQNSQRSGNSYVNLSKKTIGGVVEDGDTLEIRMTINHTSGTIFKLRYLDSLPTHTLMLTGASDRLRVVTNEGYIHQSYTLAPGDDAATYIAAPGTGNYQVRMNLNFDGTVNPAQAGVPPNNTTTEFASATGQVVAGNVPNIFGSTLFATAFRVVVDGAVGDTIRLGAGKFIYSTTAGGADITFTATPYKILITDPLTLCTNATGVNMSEEFGGTFGTGTSLNRATDLTTPIPGYTYTNISDLQALGDGQYAIVKNMSPRSGVNRNAERSPVDIAQMPDQNASDYRMHGGHWDVDGDHTGTNNSVGNIPRPDGVTGGYMLMVNADYVASETYRQTLSNLCPNTYYEFSAWFRNVCPTCGNDYINGGNYSPREPGVMPNLTFSLDGLDRYNTGEIPYYSSGSTASGWVKKGFVFRTGPSQVAATFTIRNNAQGGGGNDWAMDDVTVATCLPNMSYSPSLSPTICAGTYLGITDTITSFYNNYTNYIWQRSTNGGGLWTDIGSPHVATLTPFGTEWRYIAYYNIPPALTTVAQDGNLYRVIVATTALNLANPSCQVTDGISIITMDIISCGVVLKTDLLSFNGSLVNDKSRLIWTTSKEEEEPVKYLVERSTDGTTFTQIGVVNGYNNDNNLNEYSFVDPTPVNGKVYYRVVVTNSTDNKKYTRTIQLSKTGNSFALTNVINPFNQSLEFDVNSPAGAKVDAELLDMFGKIVKRKSYMVQAGVNMLRISDTEPLAAGTYILFVRSGDQIITKKVLKKNIL